MAQPSPMSMMPAFSPGPDQHARALRRQLLQMEARAFIGAVLAPHDREDAEFGFVGLALEDRADFVELDGSQIAHAVAVPRAARRYGPCDFENHAPVGGAQQRIGGALGMRHHAHHVAAFIADAGDIAQRAVGIIDVAQHHAILRFQHVERAFDRRSSSLRRAPPEFEHLASVAAT